MATSAEGQLEAWQKHIRSGQGALCGAAVGPFEWMFLDADHATSTVASGSRLEPCPRCAVAAERDSAEPTR